MTGSRTRGRTATVDGAVSEEAQVAQTTLRLRQAVENARLSRTRPPS